MPQQTEPSANNALGELLAKMLPGSVVRSEHTQVIVDYAGRQPDILVTSPGRSPVVLEAEYMPATNAEAEARSRLGLEVVDTGRLIESAIALRYPEEMRNSDNLAESLAGATLSYCVVSEDEDRFPGSGWIEGSVGDLAELVRLVSVPQRAVDQAADALEKGIERAASILNQLHESRPDVMPAIAGLLGMADVIQTRRMAGAIIANAMVFHERLGGMHGVKPLSQLCSGSIASPKREILGAWSEILKINYWPIFAIAKDIVDQIPAGEAAQLLTGLRTTVEDVAATGANQAHDLTGRIFQRLIADRKYLATFYTLPSSAALLARLAVAKLDGIDWSDADAVGKLRIGDFACGTGALLSAVYDQIAVRHEQAGGDLAALHPVMMEEVLYGCDVMPSAIHITGSTLSGAQPTVKFGKSRLYTLAYGRQDDGTVRIGSLELLQSSATMTLFNTADPALRTGSAGEETAAQVVVEIPDEGFDLVIMNPPFTRPGSDWEGSKRAEDYIKHFRGLSTGLVAQKEMAKSLSRYTKDTCYHGYAGIASAFAALAHKKIKPGGVLALVLPLSATAGLSWQGFREMIAQHYTRLTVLTIAAADNDDISFSADTGMAECLIIARKLKSDETSQDGGSFTSLRRKPQGFTDASSLAGNLLEGSLVRRIEDGPYGGTPLMVGDGLAGETITSPLEPDGESWGAVRLSDHSLAQTAYFLSDSKLWLPGMPSSVELKITTLNSVGRRGWHDINIAGSAGPFTKTPSSPTSTYPSLWSHNAKQETRMVCLPDSQMLVKPGMEVRAAEAWATASRAHLNRDFRFNSQPLSAAFTEQASIGGRAWPNVLFDNQRLDFSFTVWANSTLGLICFWWHSNRQVAGRGTTTVSAVDSLSILDLRTLTDEQLSTAKDIFDEFRDKELMPAYLADADPNRALLDRRVICDLLGFDQDTYQAVRRLSAKWCAEPSVHGGKKRPVGATLVM